MGEIEDGLYWPSDARRRRRRGAVIEPHLPHGRPGAPRVDVRRVISGILHVLEAGCRRRDCPAAHGPRTTICNRCNRWARQGIWRRLFERPAGTGSVPEELAIGAAHSKAPRSAAGANRGKRRGRSAARGAAARARSLCWPMLVGGRSPSC